MFSPLSISKVAYECRKVCQPIHLVMPARLAAGLTVRLRRIAGQYGIFPNLRGLAKPSHQALSSHSAFSMTTTLSPRIDPTAAVSRNLRSCSFPQPDYRWLD